jgi:hypothetical protein
MRYLIALLLLASTATAGENAPCAPAPQIQLDFYFMVCMDQTLPKCDEIGADVLMTNCGSRVGEICRKSVRDYEYNKWIEYGECLLQGR